MISIVLLEQLFQQNLQSSMTTFKESQPQTLFSSMVRRMSDTDLCLHSLTCMSFMKRARTAETGSMTAWWQSASSRFAIAQDASAAAPVQSCSEDGTIWIQHICHRLGVSCMHVNSVSCCDNIFVTLL